MKIIYTVGCLLLVLGIAISWMVVFEKKPTTQQLIEELKARQSASVLPENSAIETLRFLRGDEELVLWPLKQGTLYDDSKNRIEVHGWLRIELFNAERTAQENSWVRIGTCELANDRGEQEQIELYRTDEGLLGFRIDSRWWLAGFSESLLEQLESAASEVEDLRPDN